VLECCHGLGCRLQVRLQQFQEGACRARTEISLEDHRVGRGQVAGIGPEEAQVAITSVDEQWRAALGADRYDEMLAALRDLGRDVLRY
jgi:hypothetical protein